MRKGYKVSVSINKEALGRKKDKKNKKESQSDIASGIDIINKHKSEIAQSRKQRIGKTMNEAKQEYIEEYEEELENKGFAKRIKITIIIALLLVIVYLFFAYGPIFGISLNKDMGINDSNKIDIVSTDDDIYNMYNSELLIYSNKSLLTYNKYGKVTWEYKLEEMFTPQIYINKGYLAVTNNTNGTIYLFHNKKEILNKKIDGSINNVFIDDDGNMAIEYSTSGYKKIIGVYSKNGNLLYNAYLTSGSIIDLKILENAKKLLVFQTDASSFKVGTVVSSVDGSIENDNVKEILKLDNNMIYDLTIRNQDIIIVLDNKIIKYNMNTGSTTDIKSFELSQILFASIADNYYTIAEKKLGSDSGSYLIETIRLDNSVISHTDIANAPKMMKSSGMLNYFVYQDRLQVFNKWGIEIKNTELDFPPKDIVIFNNEKSVALIYTNKVYIVNM